MGIQTAELPAATSSKPFLRVIPRNVPASRPKLGFVAAFDLLGHAIGVYDSTGRPIHCTAAFQAALRQGETSSLVGYAVKEVSAQVESAGLRKVVLSPVCFRDHGRVIRASHYQPSGERMVLVCIEVAAEHQAMTDEEIMGQFGLTPAEVRVARLLAAGEPNKVIATTLGASEHTTRHHTEHVFRKLGINSRAAVGRRLRGE
jgi:DNA-binding NarL/FixJ family response regulator